MSLGKRTPKQPDLFVPHGDLPSSPGHPFYKALNRVLAEAHFDDQVDSLCSPYYRASGRPSIPPGVYFRMLLVGYFEDIDSQRGIAWRCADSLSLKEFLGLSMDEAVPDHSSLTRVRRRLPIEVHEDVFRMVLGIALDKKLLDPTAVGVDSTYVEANAAMKSIVRKDTAESYAAYARRLAVEDGGLEDPTDEEVRRFDRSRSDKKVSNKEWESSTDPDSRIVKMKDGRTHLGYKAEHVVDLNSDLLVGAEIYAADQSDTGTLLETIERAERHLRMTGRHKSPGIEEVVADKGYHSTENLTELQERGKRSYIPEAERPHGRRWKEGSEKQQCAVYENRRRMRRAKGRAHQRLRSEMTERSFAHVCNTGGARRSWLRGLSDVAKYHLLRCAARNLGVILRALVGIGTPKSLQGTRASVLSLLLSLLRKVAEYCARILASDRSIVRLRTALS